jgi:hypothetical protein
LRRIKEAEMKKNVLCLFSGLFLAVGLLASPALADLGLAQIMTDQGAPAVGQTVLVAAQTAYAGNTDPAVIQNQLIAMLNEAGATANEQAVRYTIVAVMVGGGVSNLDLSEAAINSSELPNKFSALTASTVAQTKLLIQASGGAGTGGGQDSGGGSAPRFVKEFDTQNPFAGSGAGGDKDLPATPI